MQQRCVAFVLVLSLTTAACAFGGAGRAPVAGAVAPPFWSPGDDGPDVDNTPHNAGGSLAVLIPLVLAGGLFWLLYRNGARNSQKTTTPP